MCLLEPSHIFWLHSFWGNQDTVTCVRCGFYGKNRLLSGTNSLTLYRVLLRSDNGGNEGVGHNVIRGPGFNENDGIHRQVVDQDGVAES